MIALPDRTDPTDHPRHPEHPVSHPATEAARLRRLLEAQSLITGDLELGDLLGRVVGTACELVGARYGGIGVIGEDGRLERFVHRGLEGAAIALAENGTLPRAALRRAMHEAEGAVRIDDLHGADAEGDDPFDLGFDLGDADDLPEGFPLIRSFLGVPIRVRGELFGDLYLSDPRPSAFGVDDEELVQSLAITAGSAIANSRLLADALSSRHWLRASGEVARALLAAPAEEADVSAHLMSGPTSGAVSGAVSGSSACASGIDSPLATAAVEATTAAEADLGLLLRPEADGTLRVVVALGDDADAFAERTYAAGDTGLARLLGRPTAFVRPSVAGLLPDGHPLADAFGALMAAPLTDHRGFGATLVLVRRAERRPFRQADLDMLRGYADQVSIALDLDEARTDTERLRLLQVRHDLSRELHDTVVQRLFATGASLQSLTSAGLAGAEQARLQRCVDELDETIEQIREQVLALRAPSDTPAGPRVTMTPRDDGGAPRA
ncbi:GAF domain-containing protein [Jatrophihabitans fulvus]